MMVQLAALEPREFLELTEPQARQVLEAPELLALLARLAQQVWKVQPERLVSELQAQLGCRVLLERQEQRELQGQLVRLVLLAQRGYLASMARLVSKEPQAQQELVILGLRDLLARRV
jgi:hypothetical protein